MKFKVEEHFLVKNPKYNIIYISLLKEAAIWNNSGQYWLGKIAENKAAALLNGNVEDCRKITKSEDYIFKTKRM